MITNKQWSESYKMLVPFVRKRVQNQDDAEDLVQESLAKAFEKQQFLKDQKKIRSWLYQIARNTIADYYRKQKHTADLDFEIAESFEFEDSQQKAEKCLTSCMNDLNDSDFNALQETDLGSMSQHEYAQKHGLSHTGAKSRIQRARKKLKEVITKCCDIKSDQFGNILDVVPRRRVCCVGG